jgi:hypothetical protein
MKIFLDKRSFLEWMCFVLLLITNCLDFWDHLIPSGNTRTSHEVKLELSHFSSIAQKSKFTNHFVDQLISKPKNEDDKGKGKIEIPSAEGG